MPTHRPEIRLAEPVVRHVIIDDEPITLTSVVTVWTDGVPRGMTSSNLARPMVMVYSDNARCTAFAWKARHDGQPFNEEAWIREGIITSDEDGE